MRWEIHNGPKSAAVKEHSNMCSVWQLQHIVTPRNAFL